MTTFLFQCWSVLVQVMTWCLAAPSLYLNQYWFDITLLRMISKQMYQILVVTEIGLIIPHLKLLPYLPGVNVLTHWGRVTHTCVSKPTIIGSGNGLSPDRRQAIIWTNAGISLIGLYGTNFNEILIKMHTFSFKKMHLKMSSGNWRPFCLGLNVLTHWPSPPLLWVLFHVK